jgi:hypothetical protein
VSDSSITLTLHNRAQAYAIIKDQLYPFIGRWLQAEKKLELVCRLPKRSKLQNARYWGRGVLAQIAEQATVGGKLYDAESWHEMFKRKFIGVIELPDGSVVGKSSTELTTAEFCKFCDEVEAFAATELGVLFIDLPR